MDKIDYAALNARYGIGNQVVFKEGPGGLALVEVKGVHGSAAVALQGAQLLSWMVRSAPALVWLSPAANYVEGKSVRGGVPICWPWFGPHPMQPSFPTHGFARTLPWDIVETQILPQGETHLAFQFTPGEATSKWWPHASRVECHMVIGEALEMELVTYNLSRDTITITEALHTYFGVSDIRQVRVLGLEGIEYLDKVGGGRKRQEGAITFDGETDRVYLNTTDACVIDDPGHRRRIHITKHGSRSTVVWNPWIEKAAKLGDLGEDGYLHMLCVESANAIDDAVTVAPGAEHRLRVRYSVEAY